MGKVCNYVTLLTFLVALLTKLEFIRRVYITELLLFLLALFVVAFGTAVSLKQLYTPQFPIYVSKIPGRGRSSLLKKYLKTMDADAAGIDGPRALSDGGIAASQHTGPLAEEAAPASPPPKADGARSPQLREERRLTGRALSPPLPPLPPHATRHQHRQAPLQLGVPQLYSFEEPGTITSTLSTTFNPLLHPGSDAERRSSGRHSGGLHDSQLNSSGSAYAAALQVTQRPSIEGAGGVAMLGSTPEIAPSEHHSLTAGFMHEHVRADSPPSPNPGHE
jgi:hypothetical protein